MSRCAAVPAILLAAIALAVLVIGPATARANDAELDKQVQAVLATPGATPGATIDVGIWFGTPSGELIYQLAASRAMPAASVVKTALLIELFAAHAGHLDDPLGAAADAILADDKHPAMAPLPAAGRDEARAVLHGVTVRTAGAIMMGSKPASNAVYNGAASLVIASLGGPADATAKIHARDPRFAGVMVRRYMLASRSAGDNDATPEALAAVLASIASATVPRVSDAATVSAMADAMLKSSDPALGVHRHKEGYLDNDPMVCIKTGFYARGNGRPSLVYVVGAALSARPTGSRDAAHRRLDKLTDGVLAALRAAARR